ncbi:MAG: hypothetical protein AAF126_01495 [Chloroflexota bacterium]
MDTILTDNPDIDPEKLIVSTAKDGSRVIVEFENVSWQTAIENALTAHDASVLRPVEQKESARQSIRNKADLAKQYANEIAQLFNATLDATQNRTAQPTRYETLKALIDSFPNSIKNRFYDDLEAESATSITTALLDTIDTVLAGVTPTLTANQRRQTQEYCQYARTWATQLSLLLLIG